MNNKVWLISVSKGQWEDFATWIDSVYDSEEAAIAAADKLDRRHLLSEQEYEQLPAVYKDRWDNPYNVADILYSGSEEEHDKWETGALSKEKKEGYLEFQYENKPMFVAEDFLKEFDVKLEDVPHLVDLAEYSSRMDSPDACVIIEFELNTANYKIHPVYDGIHNPTLEKINDYE